MCIFASVSAASEFVTMQRKAEFQEHYAEGAVYVLSMAWFREWENFVCCKTDGLLNDVQLGSRACNKMRILIGTCATNS